MDWRKRRVLITGGGGFIASHLIERLVGAGAKVRVFVRYNSRNNFGLVDRLPSEVREKIDVIAGDVRDYNAIYGAAKGVDMVFHLAALIAIPYSYVHPKDVIETNIMGTFNVMEAGRRLGVRKIVHTSTSEVYGTAITVPISEVHPLQAQSPYSASKIGADKIAESFFRSFATPVAIIRPFNTYGPRQSLRAVIPTIVSQVLKGNILRLGLLSPKRDFCYVKDTVEGFIKVAESNKTIGEVVNIGSGAEISIEELANKIISITGRNVKIIKEGQRLRPKNSEVNRLLADNQKAKRLFSWKPTVSLDEGLEITINWIRDNLNYYKSEIYNL